MKVRFHGQAAQELAEAEQYYFQINPQLRHELRREVRELISRIARFPHSCREIGGFRACALHKYPYTVVYQVSGTELRILAFAHHKRRSMYWHRRVL